MLLSFDFFQSLPNKFPFALILAVPEREGGRRKPDGRVLKPSTSWRRWHSDSCDGGGKKIFIQSFNKTD